MIQHCVVGQAGSGKSTFIEKKFPRDEYIFFDTGSMLRGMFTCLKGEQTSKNVWDFANPLVYSVYKQCCAVSEDTGYEFVTDGFPRNSSQVKNMHMFLNSLPNSSSIVFHMLDISEEEQARRIESRNGKMSGYHVERISQSRRDFESVLDELERIMESSGGSGKTSIEIRWYDQKDDDFILSRSYK
tara:strand:+ start:212 stop:769 length:558 start_codon:yes stop_codon:yes gene_type:complete